MNPKELSPIQVHFEKPTGGYWDGGQKSGGTFEPSIHNPDDPKTSYVKWGSWELNHWFNQPLHYEKGKKAGQPIPKTEVMSRARRHLRTTIRIPATVI